MPPVEVGFTPVSKGDSVRFRSSLRRKERESDEGGEDGDWSGEWRKSERAGRRHLASPIINSTAVAHRYPTGNGENEKYKG